LKVLPGIAALLFLSGGGPLSSLQSAPPSGKAPPGAEKILERFYPEGREEWFQGLWIPLRIEDPGGSFRLFLTPKGWARLQARVRGPQEWSVLGPRGAWTCGPGYSKPLAGAARRRLRLLARGLSLLALWPLGDRPRLLPSSPPSEPVFLLGGGRRIRIRLDEKGLPGRIFLSGPLGKKTRVLVPPGTARWEEGPPWPKEAVLQDETGGPPLKVVLGRIRPCLLTSPSFFSPPGGKKASPSLPGGFRPGAIRFTKEKPARAVVLADPGEGIERRKLILETGKALARAGLDLEGLPFFVNRGGTWEIWIPFRGKGSLPGGLAARELAGGLYASIFYEGPPHETLLEKVPLLEKEVRRRNLEPAGPVQIGIFLLPGSLESLLEGEQVLARIRVRVTPRKD